MRQRFVTRLLRVNVHMGRVGEGPEDVRVLDLAYLADELDRKGETDEALALSREAVSLLPRVRARMAEMEPGKHRKYAPRLAGALKRLAVRLRAGGFDDDALTAVIESVAVVAELADAHQLFEMGGDCWELAEEQLAAGRNEDAIAVAELAVRIWKRIDASDGVLGVGCSLNLLSRGNAAAGRWDAALAAADEAVAIFSANGGGPDLQEALTHRSAALEALRGQ